jgi:predicted pyridoxine 5'-phosphate oxidase superfamily flavin-nucleotide-binding protein
MTHRYAQIAFTDTVRAEQARQGSAKAYARMLEGEAESDRLGDREAGFILARDSFYMATVSETGWPYMQHRGGPAGFVKPLDATTLAFADFRGNRQYISTGNLTTDDRVSLFFMDYLNRARLKLMGRARISEDPEVVARVTVPDYKAKVERAILIGVEAFDWNCPQHITPRFTEAEVRAAVAPLHERIADLEARLAE